jgi:hypothetical protein
MKKTIKNKLVVITLACILLIYFLSIYKRTNKLQEDKTTIHPTAQISLQKEDKNDLSISKERFDYYNQTFINLNKLQAEYEKTYQQYGEFGLEKAKTLPLGGDYPHYNFLNRDIAAIHQSIPKFKFEMSTGEKYLLPKMFGYSTALIFLSPKKNELEGQQYAIGKRKIIEDALLKVKDFNNFY